MKTRSRFLKYGVLSILILLAVPVGLYVYMVLGSDNSVLPESHGKVVSQLFMGDESNLPLIVGLGGAEGGNAWASNYWKTQRDDFIQQGYAFLALGYFGLEGAPKELDRIALEGVYQAIIDAAEESNINRKCIAVIGASKGAELALLLASHYSAIKTVIAIVPGHAVFAGLTAAMNTSSFSLNNEPLPFVPVPWSATPALIKGDLRAAWEHMLKDQEAVERAAIPVEKINGPIYFVSATEDEFWPSSEMSDVMMKRLEDNNFAHYVQHTAIEGDHAAPLAHFDAIEDFLNTHFRSKSSENCGEPL